MVENNLPIAVIDTSFLISALFSTFCDDENNYSRDFIENIVLNNGKIFVPSVFWFEIGNVLLNATKTKNDGSEPRLSQIQGKQIINQLSELPISTDSLPDYDIRNRIMDIAQKYELSYYDASYLELSQRFSIPLKTYNKLLLNALQIR